MPPQLSTSFTCKTAIPELPSVFCTTFHVNGTASYCVDGALWGSPDDVTLVFSIMLICGPSAGTTFCVQPAAPKLTASRMLIIIATIKRDRDFVVFMFHASNAYFSCGIAVSVTWLMLLAEFLLPRRQ